MIEKIGCYFDQEGFQPIAGRIIGLLMVMDKEQFTFDEICEELYISKSSASNVLRNLEIRGAIEYTTIPGDRKKYYRIKAQNSFDLLGEFERKAKRTIDALNSIVGLKADPNSTNAVFFKEVITTMGYYLENLSKLKEQYNK